MRVLAKYLPQFHRVRENDEWWGDGFTEWTAVKKAEKLFEGHNQPRIPQGQNYYDLLEKETMLWQASLMEKYKVDGMCMYHYWFRDGRRILEKPAENLRKWTDINMPYCFCWANETWARTWSRFSGANAWSDIYEHKKQATGNGILLEQAYGAEAQWVEHFAYLQPFFEDERYIKVDGKPLFLVYKAADIPCLPEMLACWRKLAAAKGLGGIYVVGAACNKSARQCVDATLETQPAAEIGKAAGAGRHDKNGVRVLEYDDIWTSLLAMEVRDGAYLEGFSGFDDTPRRGTRGTVAVHAAPEKFAGYLTELMAKSAAHGRDILFLNAWNEWGEGMYLEPDECFGEKYLEAIPFAKENYKNHISKYVPDSGKKEKDVETALERDRHYLNLLDEWMRLRENGFLVSEWLQCAGYTKIAVYGYGICGKHLCRELQGSGVEVAYLVDRNAAALQTGYRTYLPSDELPEADLMVVTATYEYGGIYSDLADKGTVKIISLESILREVKFAYAR